MLSADSTACTSPVGPSCAYASARPSRSSPTPWVASTLIGTFTMLPPVNEGSRTNTATDVSWLSASTVANIAVGVSGTVSTGRPASARLAAVYWRIASVPVTSRATATTTTTIVVPSMSSVRDRRRAGECRHARAAVIRR